MVRSCFAALLLLPAVQGRESAEKSALLVEGIGHLNDDDAALLSVLQSQKIRVQNADEDAVPFKSVEQRPSEDAGAPSGKFVQHDLNAYDEILKTQQALLERVVQGQSVSSEELSVFDVGAAFHSIIEDLKLGVQNQRDVSHQANNIIADCNSRLSSSLSILEPKKERTETFRRDHRKCREDARTKTSTKSAACSSYEQRMNAARNPPQSCAQELGTLADDLTDERVRTCIKKMQDWICPFEDLDALFSQCKKVESDLDNVDKNCDETQVMFEAEVCAYTEELHFTCIEQDMCIGDAVARRDKLYAAMQKMNEQTARLYITMQRIKCVTNKFHHVTNHEVNVSEVNVTECLHQNHDVPEDLTQVLDEAVDRQECDIDSVLLRRPGTPEFKEFEYSHFDGTSLEEPHACGPLPEEGGSTTWNRANTYVRWGHSECPDGAYKLYTGFAASGHFRESGGGANALCLHSEPTFPEGVSAGNQNGARLYGTEYQNTGAVDKNQDHDAVCAVCAVRGATYTQWGRDQCPSGHRQEYTGLIMANHYNQQQKNEFVCVDKERGYTERSNTANRDGNLWYTTEFEQGSLPGDVFKHNHEASCAQCTITDSVDTYVRWGNNDCPSGATTIYTGFVAGSHYSHSGGGTNALCLHPEPTFSEGLFSAGNQNGALLYGTEYQNTGAVDKNHNNDAVCAVCAVTGATYTQWARDECPAGTRQEYKGIIMANHHTQQKNEFVCVDEARQYTARSNPGNHDGNLWYSTEFEQGSLPGDVFKHDHEASCSQCTKADNSDTYVRWGHNECPNGANKLYTGYASGAHYSHSGSGANTLCLHPEPTFPEGFSAGNQNGALLYGTEYQNTGAVDKNHDHDAVCTVCAVTGATYTQWGRDQCPSGHRQEYTGLIMANQFGQRKNEFVCVDQERLYTSRSNTANRDGNLWYTTEFEQGSLPGEVFKHNHEASCAQCTVVTNFLVGELTMYVR